MTPEKAAHFAPRLQEELSRLEGQLGDLGRKDPETGQWEAGPGSFDPAATEPDELADRMEAQEENAEEVGALTARARDVRDALERIARGTYGVCEVGGEAIEEARLEANPAARTCTKHL